MSDLPKNWTSANILELSRMIRGVTYSKNDARDEPSNGLIPILRAMNITERGLVFDDLVYVPRKLVKDEQVIKAGDVVIAISSGSITVVGKAKQTRTDLDAAFGAFCAVLRPVAEIDPRYFGHFFGTQHYRFTVSSLARGVNINNLKRDHFEEIDIPVAPLNEQKRIAEKLDSLLARVDSCQTHLERVPQILKRFRQSVLAAATSGRLTEDWREKRGQEGETRQIFFDEDWIDIPNHWEDFELYDIIDPERPLCYGVIQPGEEVDNGVLLVRVLDMENWKINIDGLRTISPEIDANYQRSKVKPGDVLLSVVGTIGRTAIVPEGLDANIARAIAKISCRENANPRWVNMWLSCNTVQWWLTKSAREVARKTLNLSQLGTARIALPSPEEQAEIVRRVESLFAYAERLEARYRSASEQVEQLIPSLLAKAFRGELVEQDAGMKDQ